jgi:hypothetical protein
MTEAVTRHAGTETRHTKNADRTRRIALGAGWGWSFAASKFNANGWMHSKSAATSIRSNAGLLRRHRLG